MKKKPNQINDPEELATEVSLWMYQRFRMRPPPLSKDILPLCRGTNMKKILNYLVQNVHSKQEVVRMKEVISEHEEKHQNARDKKYLKVEKRVKKIHQELHSLYEKVQSWHEKVEKKTKSMRNIVRYFTTNFSFGEHHKLGERQRYEEELETLIKFGEEKMNELMEGVIQVKEVNEILRTRRHHHQESMDLFIPLTSPFYRKKIKFDFKFKDNNSSEARGILNRRKHVELLSRENPKKLLQVLKAQHVNLMKDIEEELYLLQCEKNIMKKRGEVELDQMMIEATQNQNRKKKLEKLIDRKQREHISVFNKIRNCERKIEQLNHEYFQKRETNLKKVSQMIQSMSNIRDGLEVPENLRSPKSSRVNLHQVLTYLDTERELEEKKERNRFLENQIQDLGEMMEDTEEKDFEVRSEIEAVKTQLKNIRRTNLVQAHSNEELILDIETQIDRVKSLYRERISFDKYNKIENHISQLDNFFTKKLKNLNENLSSSTNIHF